MLTRVIQRFTANLKNFQSLQELNRHLRETKPNQTVVYFRANWNPQCEQADHDIQKFAASNPGIQVIKVDSDVAPKIAKHYSVKAEPEFVFCLYGDQVLRQIGLDYNKLEEKSKNMDNLSKSVDLSLLDTRWVQYGTRFQAYYQRFVKEQYNSVFSDFCG